MHRESTRKPGQKVSAFGEKGMRMVRTWETLFLLAETDKPLTAEQLNQKLLRIPEFMGQDFAVQTTREDLKMLRKCGFPISAVTEQDEEIDLDSMESMQGRLKNIRWAMREPMTGPELEFPLHRRPSAVDLLSLSLCRAFLGQQIPKDYPLYRSVGRLLDELQLKLNRQLRLGETSLTDLQGRVLVMGKRYVGESVGEETWRVVTTAIHKRQVLLADYQNRDGDSRRVDIAPLAFWFAEGRGYLLAAGATDEKIRSWRLDRFSNMTVAKERKQPEVSEQEVEETLRKSYKGYISDPIQLKLKVRAEVAYLFRDYQFHPTQQVSENPDGSLEVQLECAAGWPLEEWILGFGEFVTVIEPESFRQAIIKRINLTAQLYSDNN